MKILIADDLVSFRLILELALKEPGHEVAAAADGEKAWRAWHVIP